MRLFILLSLLFTQTVLADVYLQAGESRYISGDRVHCGVELPRERGFTCEYTACVRSANILNVSETACRVHNTYSSYTKRVWAYEGSEAESKVEEQLANNPDVVHVQYGSVNCY